MLEPAPIWNVGGRRLCEFRCKFPKTSGVNSTCRLEVILPDKEVLSYTFYYQYKGKLYSIYGDENGSSTLLSHIPSLTKERKDILLLNKFYPINLDDSLMNQVDSLFLKLKLLTTFS